MMLRNLPSHLNSRFEHIHLASLFYADVSKYGFGNFLKPLMKDLKILETEAVNIV